jgi:hypothetical protein
VRQLVRTEVGLVVGFAIAMLVAYIGLAIFVSGTNRFAGALVLIAGLWSMVSAPVVHDRLHREHGEASHAVWGGSRPGGRPGNSLSAGLARA